MEAALAPKRRSHLTRCAIQKGVQITENDIADIFEPLARHAQLTTRQLVAFGTRHPIITKARLGELWHATEDQRSHDHMASDITLDIEIGARRAGLPFQSHVDILRAAPAATYTQKKPLKIPVTVEGRATFVEPDALFAIAGRAYALEADTGTESIRAVIIPKILAYREIVAAGVIDDHLGIDNLTVLFATPSEMRMRNIMSELATIARNGRSTMFAFSADATFGAFLRTPAPTGRLVHSPWQRVGHDEVVLDRNQG
jgi:hypothetical protein